MQNVHRRTIKISSSCRVHTHLSRLMYLLYARPHSTKHFILFAVTIDDFLVVTNHQPRLQQALSNLQTKYSVKDLGPATHIVGWKIEQTSTSITISQSAYIQQVLARFQLSECTPAPSPYLPDVMTSSTKDDEPIDPPKQPYIALIGSLRYLADSTRPDIAHATSTRPLPL